MFKARIENQSVTYVGNRPVSYVVIQIPNALKIESMLS